MADPWLEAYEATLPWRVAFGLGFFLVLGVRDYRQHPEDPKRAKEYLFLLFAAAVAVVYAVLHDHITATISRAYFVRGKGIPDDRWFRLRVTSLAAQASYWVGLVAGVALLLANNPARASPTRELPRLPYARLRRLVLLPLACAAAAAVLGGVLYAFDAFSLGEVVRESFNPQHATRFLIVWGVHTGSYLGGAVGAVLAVVRLRRERWAGVRDLPAAEKATG